MQKIKVVFQTNLAPSGGKEEKAHGNRALFYVIVFGIYFSYASSSKNNKNARML